MGFSQYLLFVLIWTVRALQPISFHQFSFISVFSWFLAINPDKSVIVLIFYYTKETLLAKRNPSGLKREMNWQTLKKCSIDILCVSVLTMTLIRLITIFYIK